MRTEHLKLARTAGLWMVLLTSSLFDPGTVKAQDLKPDQSKIKKTLTITTYNVLADSTHADIRTKPLLTILKETQSDVIALQEVTSSFLEKLNTQPWMKDRHLTVTPKGRPPSGLLFISKWPIVDQSIQALPSFQGRYVMTATINVNDRNLLFANVHLESPLKSHTARTLQMEACLELLKESKEVFWVGDFNFGDQDKLETDLPKLELIDCWKKLHPTLPGFTWNIEKSPMAKKGSYKDEPSRRLDRIFMKSEHWTPTKTEILGDEAVSKDGAIFPSDHFGLSCAFDLKETKEK